MGTAALTAAWRRWAGGKEGAFAAPSSDLGSGLYLLATYDDTLARVQLVAGGYPYNVASIVLDRFDSTPLVSPTDVRGGTQDVGPFDTTHVDDYAFTSGVVNTYRLRAYAEGGALLGTVYATITPAVSTVWIKSVARPFLNRTVTVVDFSAIGTPARGGILEVAGRRLPVAITEVRGSRNFELVLRAADTEEAEALELFLSFGDVILLQPPADCIVPGAMFAWVGDVSFTRIGKHDSRVQYFRLPLTEVAAPDAGIIGYTITWSGVVAAWATWGDLLADPEVPTWAALLQYVSAPEDEVVG